MITKVVLYYYQTYIKLGRSPRGGGSIFGKFQGGALFLSFIAFLCDNFKFFPNFRVSQRGTEGGHQSPEGGSVFPVPILI